MEVDPEVEAPTQAVRTIGAPFEEGEVLEGRIFIEDVAAGTVALRAGKRCLVDGKLALPVSGEGQLGGLLSLFGRGSAETSALIGLDASLPIEAKWDVEMDDKRTFVELDYAVGRYRLHQIRERPNRKPANSYRRVDLATEQTPHDGHSLLGYLRRWDPPEGSRGFLYFVLGRSLLRADVSFMGKERLETRLGEREVVRIDGVATRVMEKTLQPVKRTAPKPFTLWVSDDADRVPLRLVVTTTLAELTIDLTKRTKGPVAAGDPTDCANRVDKRALAKARKPRKKSPKRTAKPLVRP